MAVGYIMEFDGFQPENYDAVSREVGWPDNWPDGLRFHAAGTGGGGLRLIEVWESREPREKWMSETIQPAIQKVAGDVAASAPPPRTTEFEVHFQAAR